ncbi:MAG: TolC family protein, partial [Sulfitobacter sp.]|nr:TolC family protein [Sulfitobacter sp.]
QTEVLGEALPETTGIRAEWAAPAEDTGQVDDDWLATFNDPQFDALIAEALDEQNPNLRILAAQTDRAHAAAKLAGAALKPTVALGAELSGTAGPDPVEQTSAGTGIGLKISSVLLLVFVSACTTIPVDQHYESRPDDD